MTESVAMSQYMVDRYGPSDLKVATNEDDYGDYLNWLSHSDATLTFPQTVFLRYTLQEIGVADKAAEGYTTSNSSRSSSSRFSSAHATSCSMHFV